MGKESYKQGLKDFNEFLLWIRREDSKLNTTDQPSENLKKLFKLFSEKLNKEINNLSDLLDAILETKSDIMSDIIDIWRDNISFSFKKKAPTHQEDIKDYIVDKYNVHYTDLHKDDMIFLNDRIVKVFNGDFESGLFVFEDMSNGIDGLKYTVDMHSPFTYKTFDVIKKIDKDNLETVEDLEDIVNLLRYVEIPLEKLPVGAKFRDFVKDNKSFGTKKFIKTYNYVKVKIENAPSNNYYKEYILGFNYNTATVKYFDSNYESDIGYLRDLEDGEIFYIDGVGYRKIGSDLAESDVIYDTVVSLSNNTVESMRKISIVYI